MQITVIIPSFKGSKNLSRTLTSLVRQTFSDFEVIVVDDNGKGTPEQINTEKVIRQFEDRLQLRYMVHPENKNGAAARNTGLKVAKGEYIALLDDDDVYLSSRLESALAALKSNAAADICFTNVLIQRKGLLVKEVKPFCDKDIRKKLVADTSIFGTGSNLFFSRKVYETIGGFNESYVRHQDIEYILRILEKFEYCIDDSVQIVKCNEGTMNIPDYEKMKKSKKIYHSDFKFLIDLFNEDEKRQYNQKEAASLFFYCLGRESKENLAAAKKELLQYRPLNKKEKVSLILTSIGTKNHNLFCITQPVFTYFKNRNCNNKMCRRIDAGILRELKELSVI